MRTAGPSEGTTHLILLRAPPDWPSDEDALELPEIRIGEWGGGAVKGMTYVPITDLNECWGGDAALKKLGLSRYEGRPDAELAVLELVTTSDL